MPVKPGSSEKALIIGGTRGLGFCLAEALFERGIESSLVGRPREASESLLLGRGPVQRSVEPLRMIFTTPVGAADLIRRASGEQPDRLTHFIYTAGQCGLSPLRTQSSKVVRELIDGSFNGLVHTLRALLALRSPNARLRITLIAGPVERVPGPQAVLEAVKAAQVQFVRSLFAELPADSTVLVIHPDPMDTAFWEGSGVKTEGFLDPRLVAARVWDELEAQREGHVHAFHEVAIRAQDLVRKQPHLPIIKTGRLRPGRGL